jgi:hypothetical protein
MLVICCGMYRSGSTWQYLVASELVEGRGLGQRQGFFPDPESIDPTWVHDDLLHVLKVPDFHPAFGDMLQAGSAKAVYSYRDVRDVICSYMRKARTSFDETIQPGGILPKVLDSFYRWTSTSGILIQKYSLIEAGPAEAVLQIGSHLGIALDRREAESISGTYSREANYGRTQALAAELRSRGTDLDKRENAYLYDQHTLLHWNHVSAERSDQWRETLGRSEIAALGPIVSPWLIETGFETDSSWAQGTENRLDIAPPEDPVPGRWQPWRWLSGLRRPKGRRATGREEG